MGFYLNPGNKGFWESICIFLNMQQFLSETDPGKATDYLAQFIPNNKEIISEFETAMSVSGWAEFMHVLKATEKCLN